MILKIVSVYFTTFRGLHMQMARKVEQILGVNIENDFFSRVLRRPRDAMSRISCVPKFTKLFY